MAEQWLGWHFTDGWKLRDGQVLEVGKTYTVEPPLKLCAHGLHACHRALDALRYAPNSKSLVVSRVELRGEILEPEGEDKACATERTVLWAVDCERLLHEWACDVAEKALRDHGVTEERSWNAIRVKRAWLDGKATLQELDAAYVAAHAGQNADLEARLIAAHEREVSNG